MPMPGGWRWGARGVDGPTGRQGRYGPQIEWDGRLWHVHGPRGYYRHTNGDLLHRAIWALHHGPIPPGYVVHHKDGNTLNNDLDNLECLLDAEHRKERHGMPRGASAESFAERSARRRAEWQRKQPREVVCQECGAGFFSTCTRAKYCSKHCRSKVYWRQEVAKARGRL